MKTITLPTGEQIMVDEQDHAQLAHLSWHRVKERSGMIYVIRTIPKPGGRQTSESMHRRITGAIGRVKVDHIDGNGLNNTRANLRVLSNQDNCRAFRRKNPNTTSRFRGVSLERRIGKWRAVVRVGKKNNYGGYFNTEEEAAKAYNALATKLGFLPEALNKVA